MKSMYNMREASREIDIPGIGRNKTYLILKALGIVNHLNRPEQKYVDAGLLIQPEPKLNGFGWYIRRNVTLVVAKQGLQFVKDSILKYLEENPMPKFPHRKKMRICHDL